MSGYVANIFKDSCVWMEPSTVSWKREETIFSNETSDGLCMNFMSFRVLLFWAYFAFDFLETYGNQIIHRELLVRESSFIIKIF